MTHSNHPPTESATSFDWQKIPAVLWVTIVTLGLIAIVTLFSGLVRGSAVALTAALCDVILLLGIVHGYKWAYVLVLVFSVAGVAVSLGKRVSQGMVVLLGDAVVIVPLLLSTRSFFPSRNLTGGSHES